MTGPAAPAFFSRRTLLSAAAALAVAGPPGLARAQGEVRYQVFKGKLFVPITVNGEPVEAMLDSGSAISGLDAGFAREAGVASAGRARFAGLQGAISGAWARDAAITVGGAPLKAARVAVIDYSDMARALQRPVQAVLGRDIFEQFVVEIDPVQAVVRLHDPAGFSAPAGAAALPLFPVRGLAAIELGLGPGRSVRALVDLGNETALIVSPGPAAKFGLLEGRATSTAYIGGHGAASTARVATLDAVTLGGTVLRHVPVQVPRRAIGAEANVGLEVLGRFRLWLDFAGRRAWLAPQAPAVMAAPFWKDRTGLSGRVEDGRLVVLHVAANGPAERAGWRTGDVVTAINGEPAALANAAFDGAPAGATLAFTMADGTTRRLTLADYY